MSCYYCTVIFAQREQASSSPVHRNCRSVVDGMAKRCLTSQPKPLNLTLTWGNLASAAIPSHARGGVHFDSMWMCDNPQEDFDVRRKC